MTLLKIERALLETKWGYIHYRATGSPHHRAIFLQHINQQSSALYLELMAVLGKQFRVVAIDYPSHGDSDHLAESPTIGDYAGAVLAVADALKIKQFSVLGEAVGAAVSIELAANHAERVEKTILLNCPFYATRQVADARHAPLKNGLRPEDASGFPMTRTLEFLMNNDPGHAPMRPSQGWMDRVNTAQIQVGRDRWQALDALHRYELNAQLKRVGTPILLLIGEHFYYLKYREEFHQAHAQLRSEVVAGACFCMGWEKAEVVGAKVIHFLAEV